MKKQIILIFILLVISYTTGIFVEITVPDSVSISPDIPSLGSGIWHTIKNDFSTFFLTIFFSLSVWLLPCTGVLLLSKAFALGFSSAFLLSGPDLKTDILFSLLFPRACLKLPAYVLLMHISLELAKYMKSLHGRRNEKRVICRYIAEKAFPGLFFLLISSLAEILLMQLMF